MRSADIRPVICYHHSIYSIERISPICSSEQINSTFIDWSFRMVAKGIAVRLYFRGKSPRAFPAMLPVAGGYWDVEWLIQELVSTVFIAARLVGTTRILVFLRATNVQV